MPAASNGAGAAAFTVMAEANGEIAKKAVRAVSPEAIEIFIGLFPLTETCVGNDRNKEF